MDREMEQSSYDQSEENGNRLSLAVNRERQSIADTLEQAGLVDSQEAEVLRGAPPFMLAAWAISFFGYNERTTLFKSSQYETLPQPSRELLLAPSSSPGIYSAMESVLSQKIMDFYSSEAADLSQRSYVYGKVSHCSARLVAWLGIAAGYEELWAELVPDEPQTRLQADGDGLAVTFGALPDYRYPIQVPVRSVTNLGPGLSGFQFVGDIERHVDEIDLVTPGQNEQFLNTMTLASVIFRRILSDLERRSPNAIREELSRQLSFYNEVKPFFDQKRKAGRDIGVVVMSAFHYAGRQASKEAVDGAYRCLGPGGLLVVKAPVEALCWHEAGLDQVGPQASKLFGRPVDEGECGTLMHHTDDPDLPPSRPAGFMIFEKRAANRA